MKFLFSYVLLLLSLNSFAGIISITFVKNHIGEARLVKNIFNKRYSIPNSLIKLRQSEDCQNRDRRFLELCINKKGELIVLSNPNMNKIKKSLNTFGQETKNE